jgi:hypothetical protein
VGKHRRRNRPPRRNGRRTRRRTGRRIALVAAGMLVPLTGGAMVFAATTHPDEPGVHPSRSHTRHRHPAPAIRHAAPTRAPQPSAAPSRATASPLPARTAPAVVAPPIEFAPYADALSWPSPDLRKLTGDAHVRDFTMGFVAAGGGCSAAWGGLSPLADPSVLGGLKSVPGKVIVSFGGPRGTELAQDCGSVAALTGQYRAVLRATDPDGIDFFLNDAALADGAAVERRTRALASLPHAGPPISITLPLHRSGLSSGALAALRSAAAGGVGVSVVNLVPADGSGQSVIASATAAHGQLQRLYNEDGAQVWRRIGITPIIGIADTGAGFQPADAERLLAWARARGLGRLSMWSITRDTPCTADTTATNDTCSGLDEDPGTYSRIFGRS